MAAREHTRTPVLSVCGVSKSFGRRQGWFRKSTSQLALDGVSFEVHEGEMVGLLGPNGAGKTTLLKTIAALLYPTSGHVWLDGMDVYRHPKRAHELLGLVTCDERSFYWRLSGRQNLRFFAALHKMSASRARERIDSLLDTLGLDQAADRPYYGYSSGMKQKLAIARGLLTNPRLVLFDEPTRSLDPLSAARIREWIRLNRRGELSQVNVLATNLLTEAELLCDRVILLNRGKVIAAGTVQELRMEWQREYEIHRISYRGGARTLPLVGDDELMDLQIHPQSGDEMLVVLRARKDSSCLSSALTAILGSGGRVLRCETETMSFDQVFCNLIEAQAPPAKTEAVEAGR